MSGGVSILQGSVVSGSDSGHRARFLVLFHLSACTITPELIKLLYIISYLHFLAGPYLITSLAQYPLK